MKHFLFLGILFTFMSTSAQIQRGNDIDGNADEEAGSVVSLSLDGNTVAYGAVRATVNGNFGAGVVRAYSWNGSVWLQKGLDFTGIKVDDNTGSSVSLSADGNTIAVGAMGYSTVTTWSGRVSIYTWDGTSWQIKGTALEAEHPEDWFGTEVSLSSDGNTIACGAGGNDDKGTDAGHVRIFEWDGSDWVQKGGDIDGEAAGDNSGWAVSLSGDGNKVAIGAPDNTGNGTEAGHARVYVWDGAKWVQQGTDIDGEAAHDNSGHSVSLSTDGTTLAIGAKNNDGGALNGGHVRVFSWNGSSWVQKGVDLDGDTYGDLFGFSVALSSDGNTLIVGAPSSYPPFNEEPGMARVYTWNGSAWIQKGVDLNGEAVEDMFGRSVSSSANGTVFGIGAHGNNHNAGHVRVFEFPPKGIEPSTPNFIKVHPNPTNGKITVEFDHDQAMIYTILDITGRVVLKGITQRKATRIDLSDQQAGLYFLNVEGRVVRIAKQ